MNKISIAVITMIFLLKFIFVVECNAAWFEGTIFTGNFKWTDSTASFMGYRDGNLSGFTGAVYAKDYLRFGVYYNTWKTDSIFSDIKLEQNWQSWDLNAEFVLLPKTIVSPYVGFGIGKYKYETLVRFVDSGKEYGRYDSDWLTGSNIIGGLQIKIYSKIWANMGINSHYLSKTDKTAERSLYNVFAGISFIL